MFNPQKLQINPKRYSLWLFNIAMENGPFIDGLPIKNGDFPWRTVSHNQMVNLMNLLLKYPWTPCSQDAPEAAQAEAEAPNGANGANGEADEAKSAMPDFLVGTYHKYKAYIGFMVI